MTNLSEICNYIYYIPTQENPLSSEIVLISGEENLWLFDVGNGEISFRILNEYIDAFRKSCEEETKSGSTNIRIILSHFHPDHTGNIVKFHPLECFVGNNTYKYTGFGTVVESDVFFRDGIDLHIFPIPSSHAKGSLGLEVEGTYAFLGDAIYPTQKKGRRVYNVQLLKEQIECIKSLRADKFFLSHRMERAVNKNLLIAYLEKIYEKRDKNNAYIEL